MAIFLEKQEKANLQKPEEPKKWYLYSKSIGTIDESEVARQIAEETTLNPKEAEMALAQLRKVVLRNLQNSYTVRLGDWAYFYNTVHSNASKTKEEAISSKITQVKMHLGYEKAFQEELDKSAFIFAETIQKKPKEEGK